MLRNTRNIKNNSGSVLIVSLLVFSIITAVSVVCISWIYTNSRIFDLEYKDNILKENSVSGSELVKSNVLRHIRKAIDTTSDENGFNEYFLGNNMNTFINDIKNLSSGDLKNVSIKITNNRLLEENGYLLFEVSSTAKDENYYKILRVNVAIKNPYKVSDEEVSSENMAEMNFDRYTNLENINKNSDEVIKNKESENLKMNDLNECDYLRFYNYRGL